MQYVIMSSVIYMTEKACINLNWGSITFPLRSQAKIYPVNPDIFLLNDCYWKRTLTDVCQAKKVRYSEHKNT